MKHTHVHKGKDITIRLTFQDTLEAITERRPCSPASLRRYFRKLGIKPIGSMRTSPQLYPPDAPSRILEALGEKVVTMTQLRAARSQARKARAA